MAAPSRDSQQHPPPQHPPPPPPVPSPPVTTVLCHGCLGPSPYPLPHPCKHGHCRGSVRYCSPPCRDAGCASEHTPYRCQFVGRLVVADADSSVQVAVGGESFPEYRRTGPIDGNGGCKDDDDDDNGGGGGGGATISQFPPPFEPTGTDVECTLGDAGRVVLLPHQIDAGGSVLVRLSAPPPSSRPIMEKGDGSSGSNGSRTRSSGSSCRYVLVDLPALCVQTPSSVDKRNSSEWARAESDALWWKGAAAWYNDQDYLAAMKLFEESLDAMDWNDDNATLALTNGKGARRRGGDSSVPTSDEEAFHSMMLQPPPLRSDASGYRTELHRRAHFLGACLLDADRTDEGRAWLMRSLRTVPPPGLSVDPSPGDGSASAPAQTARRLTVQQNAAAMELALSYEEAGEIRMARAVASWTVGVGVGCWTDWYQRPGYLYHKSSQEEDDGWWSRPHYPREDTAHYPRWCVALEENYGVILKEFMNIVHSKKTEEENATSSPIHQPLHWPQVGSGEHRESGHDDHRVVSDGGDWREHVLFGSGAIGAGGVSSLDAPKTRALIRKYVPDAVSLADAGGGEVIFSVLAPRTRIKPHCASTNARLTAHLGLVVPKDCAKDDYDRPKCGIRVGDEWHTWAEGKFLVFDDSFEHEVVNDTDEVRAVLLLRFWHPSVPGMERDQTMAEMLDLKASEGRRRYNPPLLKESERVERRGMGWTSCARCFQTGHENVRVDTTSSAGICSCGSRI